MTSAVKYDLVLMDCNMPIMDGWQVSLSHSLPLSTTRFRSLLRSLSHSPSLPWSMTIMDGWQFSFSHSMPLSTTHTLSRTLLRSLSHSLSSLQRTYHGRLAGVFLTSCVSMTPTLSLGISLALSLSLALPSFQHAHDGRLAGQPLSLTLNCSVALSLFPALARVLSLFPLSRSVLLSLSISLSHTRALPGNLPIMDG